MSTNKLEKKMLQEIDRIDEKLGLKILKVLFRPAVRRALKNLAKDPEFTDPLKGLDYHSQELKDKIDRMKDSDDPEDRKMYKLLKY